MVKAAQLESAVRPFETPDSRSRRRLGTTVPSEIEELDPVTASWAARRATIIGQNFNLGDDEDEEEDEDGGGIRIIRPEPEDPPEPEEDPEDVTFVEAARGVTTVRVENPNDPEQFVDVERIEEVEFATPLGINWIFKFNNR